MYNHRIPFISKKEKQIPKIREEIYFFRKIRCKIRMLGKKCDLLSKSQEGM